MEQVYHFQQCDHKFYIKAHQSLYHLDKHRIQAIHLKQLHLKQVRQVDQLRQELIQHLPQTKLYQQLLVGHIPLPVLEMVANPQFQPQPPILQMYCLGNLPP